MCPCQTDPGWAEPVTKWVEPVTQWVDDLITGWTGIGGSNSGGARADETTGSLLVSSNGSAKTASPHRTITSPLPRNHLRATEEDERRDSSAGAKISPTVTLRAIAALNEQTLSLPQPESIIFADLNQEGASEFLPGACAQSDCGTASSHEPGERGVERYLCRCRRCRPPPWSSRANWRQAPRPAWRLYLHSELTLPSTSRLR